MTNLNSALERPPWPEDMEQALTAQEEKLREIKAARKRRLSGAVARTQTIRWAMRLMIFAITLWLVCETVIT